MTVAVTPAQPNTEIDGAPKHCVTPSARPRPACVFSIFKFSSHSVQMPACLPVLQHEVIPIQVRTVAITITGPSMPPGGGPGSSPGPGLARGPGRRACLVRTPSFSCRGPALAQQRTTDLVRGPKVRVTVQVIIQSCMPLATVTRAQRHRRDHRTAVACDSAAGRPDSEVRQRTA